MVLRLLATVLLLGGGPPAASADASHEVSHRRALRGEPPSSPGRSTPLRIVAHHNSELLSLERDLPSVQQSLAAWTRLSSCWTPRSESVADAAANAVAIVGFSFGQGANLTPGGTNEALAWQVARLKDANTQLKVVLQWEIADALQKEFNLTADLRITPLPGDYLSTYGVAQQAADFLSENPGTVALVAHPDHALRCALNLAHPPIGVASVWPPLDGVPKTRYGIDDQYYDPVSAQAWCRNRSVYVPHELNSRAGAVVSGEISFEGEDSCDTR